jgi:hypothetical protein
LPVVSRTRVRSPPPEDAKEAIGHGIRAKRSKTGAVSFDVLASAAAAVTEVAHAPVQ